MADTEEKKTGEEEKELSWPMVILGVLGIFVSLYVFLIGLGLMGDAFKCMGGRGASGMFSGVKNPLAGLMVGVLATVLVQSSSTSTSIVVGLVSSDVLSVKNGIPVIMGANIGTSVTNSIVSMGHIGNRIELERAFSGATVHDMFNMLTVATLLPLEALLAAITGEGGLLFFITKGLTDGIMGSEKTGKLFSSPTKDAVKPVSKIVISNNKYVINALSLGEPEKKTAQTGDFDSTLCSARRLEAEHEPESQWEGWRWVGEDAEAEDDGSRALLNRRLAVDCTEYFCVGSDLDKNLKKTSSKAYAKLNKCGDYQVDPDAKLCSGKDKCYMDAGAMYTKYVTEGHIVKGGFTKGMGDGAAGIVSLILSIILLCAGLMGLVKLLQLLLMKKAKRVIAKAVHMNDYIGILVGLGITIVVQSSSVTTSALTPLCGVGVIPLDKMLPMTLGANIGTTMTALIAALSSMKYGGLQIALCHLLFNLIGILIWFPVPIMRNVPLTAARTLGLYASYFRFVPAAYIMTMFVVLPAILLAVSAVGDASLAGGVILFLLFVAAVAGFIYWWVWMEGCYKVLSKEQREEGLAELAKAQAEVLGEEAATV